MVTGNNEVVGYRIKLTIPASQYLDYLSEQTGLERDEILDALVTKAMEQKSQDLVDELVRRVMKLHEKKMQGIYDAIIGGKPTEVEPKKSEPKQKTTSEDPKNVSTKS